MNNGLGGNARSVRGKVRCAIYTRKSSEEGLEPDFNSLDAQREACEAYIKSQKHGGWVVIETLYDDGGVSGATMERPALKRLLADIAARKIDNVVTYKIDRLTRSLADFAKIVEVFDAHEVSFVSVTQQFNTTTSMGRLTLNVLLSFAQFEREVTGESLSGIAHTAGVSRSYFTRLVKLSFLAPDITKAILEGRHPPDLTASRLINHARLSLDWKVQRTALGFT
jgi:DNA invertase Pin-like site-specific DNA recombinase